MYTLPAFVTIHGIEPAADTGYLATRLLHVRLKLVDEPYTRTRVGITAVHETMYKRLTLQSVLLGYVAQVEQVVERTVYTTVAGQTHDVQVLARLFCVAESTLNLRVLQNRTILACTIDLHQILIHNASRAYIQVTYLGVAHLAVRQTYVLATRLQLRVRIRGKQLIPMRSRCTCNSVGCIFFSDSPAVKNHQ